MAERGVDQEDEKKSYGAFSSLVRHTGCVALWADSDDNISRRPWKKYQADFYRLDINKLKPLTMKKQEASADETYQEHRKSSPRHSPASPAARSASSAAPRQR